ncbi:hypothetical protein MW344_001002 [Vibrio parahaemolyticus]|uniref:Uncharacterized protein n=1 Tax=Vibrio parahaemolyticus TaxID=670 RepID=A0A9Q3YHR4_VIBPH|nr:hypothetical protein [Vibrio parahaemolyticus]EGQ8551954.1 hypothetical protein [Vibrio parahaemolyticus]EGQ9073002.1 hypothetical protein [Vibrio parahaemolyticus]EGQ9133320.1 hypothetical protein [Vibrio parahaemolyticus]EIO3215157.1 hypothetical protein [Vibrio parahaemolyticus]EJB8436474.1 hypothetical protein [Vibrio parahaemolyticus]
MSDTIEFIFKEPSSFGLRGNDELWAWLRESYLLRKDSISSTVQIVEMVKRDLKEFGINVDEHIAEDNEVIYIKAFDKRAQHAEISVSWWRDSGLPLIEKRVQHIVGKWEQFGDIETSQIISNAISSGKLRLK